MLLAAAQALASDTAWSGTLTLIFQPAEEAQRRARMIEDGPFDKYPSTRSMPCTTRRASPKAGCSFAKGRPWHPATGPPSAWRAGGHAAKPERTIDPTVAMASLVMALQTIVSRNVGPVGNAVISVGMMHAGESRPTAHTTSSPGCRSGPEHTRIDPAVRSLLEERIREIAHGQANSYGCVAHVDYFRGYPPWSIRAGKRISPSLSRWSLSARSRWIWSVPWPWAAKTSPTCWKRSPVAISSSATAPLIQGRQHDPQPELRLQRRQRRHRLRVLVPVGQAHLVPFDADH